MDGRENRGMKFEGRRRAGEAGRGEGRRGLGRGAGVVVEGREEPKCSEREKGWALPAKAKESQEMQSLPSTSAPLIRQ